MNHANVKRQSTNQATGKSLKKNKDKLAASTGEKFAQAMRVKKGNKKSRVIKMDQSWNLCRSRKIVWWIDRKARSETEKRELGGESV